jgi:hypothetical protein
MPYVIRRVLKHGVRYTAIYTDENGRYKSAGAYDSESAHCRSPTSMSAMCGCGSPGPARLIRQRSRSGTSV